MRKLLYILIYLYNYAIRMRLVVWLIALHSNIFIQLLKAYEYLGKKIKLYILIYLYNYLSLLLNHHVTIVSLHSNIFIQLQNFFLLPLFCDRTTLHSNIFIQLHMSSAIKFYKGKYFTF